MPECLKGTVKKRRLTVCRALKTHFAALEEASDEPGVNQGRGYACEFVAWYVLSDPSEAVPTHLSIIYQHYYSRTRGLLSGSPGGSALTGQANPYS